MTDKKRASDDYLIGRLVETKRFAMRIFFLWFLHVAGVTSLKLLFPSKIWNASRPYFALQTRLYGGTAASDQEFPFMILILFETNEKYHGKCSGSLLLPDLVLTAAHCFQLYDSEIQSRNVILVGGKADLNDYGEERMNTDWEVDVNETKFQIEERRVRTIHIHPEFKASEDEILHDIALLKLEKSFTSTKNINTVPLNLDKINNTRTCTILGWGETPTSKDLKLRLVRKKEISTTSLGCKYPKSQPLICLKHDSLSGICKGDSGSPLICDGEVFGVASCFLSTTENCGGSLEEYYTELSNEKDWITSILNTGSRTVKINFIRAFTFLFAVLWVSSNILF